MRRFLILLVLLAGCDRAKQMAGLMTAEEIAAQKEAREQQLKEADFLVQKWADKLQTNSSGGFVHHEGLTDVDPWGQQLRIDYKQDWFNEVATVRSAGPDTWFDTSDDLVRTKTVSNALAFYKGMSPLAWIGIVWVGSAIGAFIFSSGISHRREAKGKPRRSQHPIGFVLGTMFLAPFALLLFGFQFIGGVFGADGGFFDGDFEFGGGPDFDIDIDF